MPFYHSSPTQLGQGSIIEPGKWGRILRNEQSNHQGGFGAYLLQEAIFEMIRIKEFPTCISRLEAAFVFERPEQASNFAVIRRCVAYEVELVDRSAQIGRHPFDLARQPPPLSPIFIQLEQLARQYWAGTSTG